MYTASPADPFYKEAIHFCHGYLVGVYQYQQEFYGNPGLSPLVCHLILSRHATKP